MANSMNTVESTLVKVQIDLGVWLLLTAVSLATIGFIMVSSASMDISERLMGNPFHFLQRHLIYLTMAFLFASLTYQVSLNVWKKSGVFLLAFAYLLLIVVLIPGIGKNVNGSTRWISLGLITVQVSEVAKVCVLAYVAGYLVRRNSEVREKFWGFIKPVLVLSVMIVLLLKEPDFGAVVVIMSAVFGMLFLAGVKFSQYVLALSVSLCAGAAMIFSSEYRMNRLIAYLDPWSDQFGAGYQLVQSLIAFGRGDLTGVGLGNSIQKLSYLPEAHTDFVFSVLAEEFGLVGNLFVIGLYLFMVVVILFIGRAAEKAKVLFGAYMAYGLGIMIGLQAFVNIGVSSGLLPTKGLTLPLMSYGGSSLIISAIIIAIILRVNKETLAVLNAPEKLESSKKAQVKKVKKSKSSLSDNTESPKDQRSWISRWTKEATS
ncbi:putative lipid II flippase FtsW [Gammaproteobacteria bacterium 42_54_T18]|nr:putative lipid II flippase FtsW [Gammaproteobacteria bacterium 42_54_T18]